MSNLGPKNIQRVFVLQGIGITIITVGLFFIRSGNEAVSALLGGLVAVLPAMGFAKLLFRHRGAQVAKKIVNAFYLGEVVKIIFAMLLFALIFRCYQVSPIVFFVTYSGIAMSFGFLLLVFSQKPQLKKQVKMWQK